MRLVLVVPVIVAFALVLPAVESPSTNGENLQPTLPPEPRTLRLAPGAGVRPQDSVAIDRNGLASDIEALTRSIQRVERRLAVDRASVDPETVDPETVDPEIVDKTSAAKNQVTHLQQATVAPMRASPPHQFRQSTTARY